MAFLRFLGKIIFAIFMIIFLLVILVCLFFYFSDLNKHKDIITTQFNQLTGQTLTLSGPLKFTLSPYPQLVLNNAKIKTSGDSSLEIQAKKVSFSLKWASIFSDKNYFSLNNGNNIVISYQDKDKTKSTFAIDKLSGNFIHTPCSLKIENLNISFGKNSFSGKFNVDWSKNITKIDGKLKAKQIYLGNKQSVDIFNWFDNIQGNIDVTTPHLILPNLTLDNAKINFLAKDKKIKITSMGDVGKTNLSAKFDYFFDAKEKIPALSGPISFKTPLGSLAGEINILLYDVPKVSAKLKSNAWTIQSPSHSESRATVFSTETIQWPLQKFNQFNGELNIVFDQLNFNQLHLNSVNINIHTKDAYLEVNHQGNLANGLTKGKTIISDINLSMPKINANWELANANAGDFLALLNIGSVNGGNIDIKLQGTSQGQSMAQIMTNLSGKSLVNIKNMVLVGKKIDSRQVDIFSAILKKLDSSSANTNVKCIAIRMVANNGQVVSNNGIGIETSELLALGAGKLNLATENLDVVLDLYSRNPVNIEIGSFDHVVYIKGNLKSPKVQVSKQGIIREGGSLLLGIATGGVSIVAEKLLKMIKQQQSPCALVMQPEN